jgi:hypothetical protein
VQDYFDTNDLPGSNKKVKKFVIFLVFHPDRGGKVFVGEEGEKIIIVNFCSILANRLEYLV